MSCGVISRVNLKVILVLVLTMFAGVTVLINGEQAIVVGSEKEGVTVSDVEDYKYNLTRDGAIIREYTGDDNKIEIPGEIEGFPVIKLDEKSFRGKGLEEVTIPDSVEVIGFEAFRFNIFNKFEDDVHFEAPENIKSLAGFNNYGEGFIEDKDFLSKFENLEVVGTNAFSSNALTEVTIPNSVVEIGWGAFSENALTEITIPESVEVIGIRAFEGNEFNSFEDDVHFEAPENIKSLAGFNNYGGGFIEDKDFLSKFENLEVIGGSAFRSNVLTEITIPGSVVEIGGNAFRSNALTEVTIPESVEVIGFEAFRFNDFNKFEDDVHFEAPENIKSLAGFNNYGGGFIEDKDFLSKFENLEVIGTNAFSSSALTEVTIPDSVVEIGRNAFQFNDFNKFEDDVHFEAPENIKSLAGFNNYGGGFIEDKDFLSKFENLEVIGDGAFRNNVLTEVTIPDSVVEIEREAFRNTTLTEVTIPDSVVKIGFRAFYFNDLTEVTIPDSVIELGEGAFQGNALTEVTIPDGLQKIERSVFQSNAFTEFTIPDSVVEIGMNAFYFNDLTEVTIPDSVVKIGGGAFRNNSLTEVTIPDSVVEIGWAAFSENALTEITIPDSVVELGGGAFSFNALTEVTIPDSVVEIGYGTFRFNALTEVTIPDSVVEIGGEAFSSNALTEVTIPDSVVEIGWDAFLGNSLTEVTIPNSVVEIGWRAFSFNALTEITIGNSVERICSEAFAENNLTKITIAADIIIEENAFDGNYGDFVNDYENMSRQAGIYKYCDEIHVWELTVKIVTIVLEANPEEAAADLSGEGYYEEGEGVTVEATPVKGYEFVNWTEDGQEVSTDAEYIFKAVEDRELMANFELKEYLVIFEDHDGTKLKEETVAHGEDAESPDDPQREGYNFIGWDTDYTKVTNDLTVTAEYEIKEYEIELSAEPEEGGTVEGAGIYEHGKEVTVIAGPSEGYAFVNWTEDGVEVSTDESYTFEAEEDRVLTANFEGKIDPYAEHEIELSAEPEEGGTVEGAGIYELGEEVTVIAEPYEDYTFFNWTEDGQEVSRDAEYSFQVTEDRELVANFIGKEEIVIKRLAGLGRYATAVEISKASFEDEAEAVVLARGDDFPDALAGVPLAYAKGGPLLLTRSHELPDKTADEIGRLLKEDDTVYVLGGEAAISEKVADELDAMDYDVKRLAGEGRFDTAVKIAEEITDNPEEVFLTTGLEFPDAVAASGPAARIGAPILLTRPDELSEDTERYLAENKESIEDIHVIGGEFAVNKVVMEDAGGTNRVYGDNRWETGTAIAKEFFEDPVKATLATGLQFPDALAGGVYAAFNDAPVLLTNYDELPDEVEDYLREEKTIIEVSVFGGEGAVSYNVLRAIKAIERM